MQDPITIFTLCPLLFAKKKQKNLTQRARRRESGRQGERRLVLYTDGLTEAMNAEEREFGEPRLVELGRRNRALSATELLEVIRKEVSGYSGSFQDDFTVVVVVVK